ncbi:MAG: family 10 glycosylhydrolase, partial [Candidatus Omnitrophica bacterium]|nr:family 10 glycosylhydrolase [Candidatus Omnitrophota bacterium]
IKVHAWINLLSIAHNKKANIIKKYGSKVLTLDQHGRTSLKGDQKDKLDKYYIRENQLFLEPGDRNVREYLTSIVKEIVTKYPKFAGIHLDYIRYPSVVPFIPGSRFSSHGISYGYTKENLKNFKEQSGIDIIKSPYSRDNYKKWDDWRRNNITKLVKKISRAVKKINPDIEVSCTIVPSPERTYLVTLQDWTKWLNEDFVDYVTVMNYTDDTKLFKLYGRSIIALAPKNKLHIGIGAYLLKDKPDILKQQFNSLHELSPAGIVFFSYDDIVRDPSALKYHEKGS